MYLDGKHYTRFQTGPSFFKFPQGSVDGVSILILISDGVPQLLTQLKELIQCNVKVLYLLRCHVFSFVASLFICFRLIKGPRTGEQPAKRQALGEEGKKFGTGFLRRFHKI